MNLSGYEEELPEDLDWNAIVFDGARLVGRIGFCLRTSRASASMTRSCFPQCGASALK